jgi:hypothetical protein
MTSGLATSVTPAVGACASVLLILGAAVLEGGRLTQVADVRELRSNPQGAFARTLAALLPPER